MERIDTRRYYISDLELKAQVFIELKHKNSQNRYFTKCFCSEKEIKDLCKEELFRFFNKEPKLHLVNKTLNEVILKWTQEIINRSSVKDMDLCTYKWITDKEYEIVNESLNDFDWGEINSICIEKSTYSIKDILVEEPDTLSGPTYCITGDTHGDLEFKAFYQARKAGYTDIFVCGDFGYIWDGSLKEQKRLDYLSNIGLNVYFVCGNHENFNLLEKYPIVTLYGGKAHKIRENIYHLMRGEIFTFGNKKILAFGGANSTDKHLRKEGTSWWVKEIPSGEEKNNARNNLALNNNKVDYIITHTGHNRVLKDMGSCYRRDEVSDFLSEIYNSVKFEHWYFGHMHENHTYSEGRTTCINKKILKLNLK